MQQIKCNVCQFTKFFVNQIGEASMIACSDCGASFIIGSQGEPQQEIEQVEEEKEEGVQVPEVIKEKKVEKTQVIQQPQKPVGEKDKPAAVQMTPEQLEALKQIENEGGD